MTANAFLRGHVKKLRRDYHVEIISNFSEGDDLHFDVDKKIDLPIVRDINILRDILSLFKLYRILREGKYDAVHSVTPKGGFVGMLGAKLARVKHRHHTFTGQVWATKTGLKRLILKFVDRLTFRFTTHSLVDSETQMNFLVSQGVVDERRVIVLGAGSISGVNLSKFNVNQETRRKMRSKFRFENDEIVFLFLGRINKEKGIYELIDAFKVLLEEYSNISLMIVGPDEDRVFQGCNYRDDFGNKLIRVDYTREPEAYFNASDIFCLPSYREGFGSVLIEAAACGTTSVASDIYGIQDAVIDGVTGLLHEPRSVDDLVRKMKYLIDDPGSREKLAKAAHERAINKYSASIIEDALVTFYKDRVG
jgi:glycosyltransferase involved in cell wall biosynthesis